MSMHCEGERCTMCNAPATHKVAEVVFDDDPLPHRHELTSYLCTPCFNTVMGVKK